jgi:acyl carrier protein
MPEMTESKIFDQFAQIVAHSLRIDATQVTRDVQLTDLGAESLDLIEISMETESQFHIFLPDKSILETAVEVFGSGILEKTDTSPKKVNGCYCAACRKPTHRPLKARFRLRTCSNIS